jgi:hypothetical protein
MKALLRVVFRLFVAGGILHIVTQVSRQSVFCRDFKSLNNLPLTYALIGNPLD